MLLQKTAWELAGKLQDDGIHPFDAWNDTQVFYMQELAKAYGELTLVAEFKANLERTQKTNEDTRECLHLMFRLDALHRMNKDIGFWLESRYIEPEVHPQMIREGIKECLQRLKRHMIALTYSFYPAENLFENMIAPRDGDLYKSVV